MAYDIAVDISGLPVAGQTVRKFKTPRPFLISNSLTGSVGDSRIAATSNAVFTVCKNGSQIGTVTYSAGVNVPMFSGAGAVFAVNDILTVTNPAVQDATLADVAFTLLGTLL